MVQIAADNNSQFLENLNYTLDSACQEVVQMRCRQGRSAPPKGLTVTPYYPYSPSIQTTQRALFLHVYYSVVPSLENLLRIRAYY